MSWTLFWQIFMLITWTTLVVTMAYGHITNEAVLRAKLLLDEAKRQ